MSEVRTILCLSFLKNTLAKNPPHSKELYFERILQVTFESPLSHWKMTPENPRTMQNTHCHYFIFTVYFTPFVFFHCPKQLPVSHFWHVRYLICLLAWIIYTSAQPGFKSKVFMEGRRQERRRDILFDPTTFVSSDSLPRLFRSCLIS